MGSLPLLQFCAHTRVIPIHRGIASWTSWRWTKHKDEGSARVLPDKRELGGILAWDHSLPGIPLPGPVPILVGLIILREAGLVLARYPFGSVTTVLQLHTFHLYIATPRPELVVRTPHSAWGSPGFWEFSRGLEALAQTLNPKPYSLNPSLASAD